MLIKGSSHQCIGKQFTTGHSYNITYHSLRPFSFLLLIWILLQVAGGLIFHVSKRHVEMHQIFFSFILTSWVHYWMPDSNGSVSWCFRLVLLTLYIYVGAFTITFWESMLKLWKLTTSIPWTSHFKFFPDVYGDGVKWKHLVAAAKQKSGFVLDTSTI